MKIKRSILEQILVDEITDILIEQDLQLPAQDPRVYTALEPAWREEEMERIREYDPSTASPMTPDERSRLQQVARVDPVPPEPTPSLTSRRAWTPDESAMRNLPPEASFTQALGAVATDIGRSLATGAGTAGEHVAQLQGSGRPEYESRVARHMRQQRTDQGAADPDAPEVVTSLVPTSGGEMGPAHHPGGERVSIGSMDPEDRERYAGYIRRGEYDPESGQFFRDISRETVPLTAEDQERWYTDRGIEYTYRHGGQDLEMPRATGYDLTNPNAPEELRTAYEENLRQDREVSNKYARLQQARAAGEISAGEFNQQNQEINRLQSWISAQNRALSQGRQPLEGTAREDYPVLYDISAPAERPSDARQRMMDASEQNLRRYEEENVQQRTPSDIAREMRTNPQGMYSSILGRHVPWSDQTQGIAREYYASLSGEEMEELIAGGSGRQSALARRQQLMRSGSRHIPGPGEEGYTPPTFGGQDTGGQIYNDEGEPIDRDSLPRDTRVYPSYTSDGQVNPDYLVVAPDLRGRATPSGGQVPIRTPAPATTPATTGREVRPVATRTQRADTGGREPTRRQPSRRERRRLRRDPFIVTAAEERGISPGRFVNRMFAGRPGYEDPRPSWMLYPGGPAEQYRDMTINEIVKEEIDRIFNKIK